ncbi:mucosal addressin cell adhesion molecule 1 [Pseudonaja textilis]|uniref:mucosal addressin cell adhesion molecule 1 n=1 Tax=Pseudonaja textilis TaxID=8673 RepID=UPI000EA9103D|nr:mucosal addressin cell adhesion molecule 1 [Pseudonaja textilis]
MAKISWIFLFSLVCNSCSVPISKPTIQPLKPLVERGGTIQLICSMDCTEAEVQWEGLDTDLGNIVSNHTRSILTLSNATINMEGTKMCSGWCQETSYLATVELNVYSFPDTLQLDSQPKMLTIGQPARLLCSMSHVYPHGALRLSWFQGDEQLEASKEMEEEEMEDSEDQLFVYHSELEIPRVAEDVTYKCKATLEVEGKIFVQERVAIAIASPKPTQEFLGATESIALTPTSGRTSPTSAAEQLTTADWKSSVGTTTSLLRLVSMEHTSSRTTVVTPTAAPMLESLTEDHRSITAVNNSTGSSYLTDQELTTKPLSTTNRFLTQMTTKGRPKQDTCRATIVLVPAEGIVGGALRITCRAENCSRDVKIWWLETPVAESRYRLEEAQGRSTLTVESVRLEHQGIYRCAASASLLQVASVRVVVFADTVKTDALFTIGATGSLFGLIITGYITHRWRQRRQW